MKPALQSESERNLSGAGIVVSPGLALDASGNEIVVGTPETADIGIETGACGFVTIQYTEVYADVVPTATGLAYSRVEERYTIAVVTKEPSGQTTPHRLCLARLLRENGEWSVDKNFHRPILQKGV